MARAHADRAVDALSTSVHAPGKVFSQTKLLGAALTAAYACWAACGGALSMTETEASWMEPSVATRAPGAGPCISSLSTVNSRLHSARGRAVLHSVKTVHARHHRQWCRIDIVHLASSLATTAFDHRPSLTARNNTATRALRGPPGPRWQRHGGTDRDCWRASGDRGQRRQLVGAAQTARSPCRCLSTAHESEQGAAIPCCSGIPLSP